MLDLAQATAAVRAARPGWKTTEFAVLAVLAASGLALIVGGLVLDDRELLAQGVELAKWAGAAYGVVRGAVKAMAVRAPASQDEVEQSGWKQRHKETFREAVERKRAVTEALAAQSAAPAPKSTPHQEPEA